jgi:hypothetical protein
MTSWTFGGNKLPQFRTGTIYLVFQPWWLALIGWFEESVLARFCDLFMNIPLPNIGKIESDGEFYTWKEYYGTVGDLIHINIHNPIFQWYYANPKRKEIEFEVGYDKLEELFCEYDKKYFTEEDDIEDA